MADSPETTVPWYTPCLILSTLALNCMLQDAGKPLRFCPAEFGFVFRSMPIVCLADTMLCLTDFCVALYHQRSIRQAVQEVLDLRRSKPQASGPRIKHDKRLWKLGAQVIVAVFASLALVKLYFLHDLRWVQAIGAMFVASYLTHGTLSLVSYSTMAEETNELAPLAPEDSEALYRKTAEGTNEPTQLAPGNSKVPEIHQGNAELLAIQAAFAQPWVWAYCLGPLGLSNNLYFDGWMLPALPMQLLLNFPVVYCVTIPASFAAAAVALLGFLADVGICMLIPLAGISVIAGIVNVWGKPLLTPIQWLADVLDVSTLTLGGFAASPVIVGWGAFQIKILGFNHFSLPCLEFLAYSLSVVIDWTAGDRVQYFVRRCAAGLCVLLYITIGMRMVYILIFRVAFVGSLSEANPWRSWKAVVPQQVGCIFLFLVNIGSAAYYFGWAWDFQEVSTPEWFRRWID